MDLKITAELLNKIPLLHGVENDLLQQLAQAMRIKKVGKKEFVIHKGEPGNELLFLIDGRLLVVSVSPDGRQTGLNFLTPGDFLGNRPLLMICPAPLLLWLCPAPFWLRCPKPPLENLFFITQSSLSVCSGIYRLSLELQPISEP